MKREYHSLWISIREMIILFAIPLIIIVFATIYTIFAMTTMSPVIQSDIPSFLENLLVAGLAMAMLFTVQFLRRYTISYILLAVGLSFVYLGQLEHALSKIINITNIIEGFSFEYLTPPGIVFIGVGLLMSLSNLINTQRVTDLRQRETELYAALLRHDLRNDLQILLGYIDLALENPKLANIEGLEKLEFAKSAAMRMSRLVKAFAMSEERKERSLVEIVLQTASDAETTHSGLSIEVVHQDDILKHRTFGNPLIQAAFENLFRNAFQHSGSNPKVVVDIQELGNFFIVVVSDNGPGIAKELRETIFERDSQLVSADEIGLYLTKTILKGCGGSIDLIDSNENSGATFKITLPII